MQISGVFVLLHITITVFITCPLKFASFICSLYLLLGFTHFHDYCKASSNLEIKKLHFSNYYQGCDESNYIHFLLPVIN